MTEQPERIICAAIYVDTGKGEPPRRSYTYPKTGLVFAGWRHADCFTALDAWAENLRPQELVDLEAIMPHQVHGRNQGFVTSKGRYVDRKEGWQIALAAGQVEARAGEGPILVSEDLY